MEPQSVIHHTFSIEQRFNVAPERVFAALSDPAKRRSWLAGSDYTDVELFETDFRAGGAERVHTRFGPNTPFPGTLLVREGSHLDIVPNRRVVTASTMSMGGHRFSASLETFELLATETGTDLLFTHQAAYFEGADGPAMREDGWRKLLDRLTTAI